MLTKGTVDVHPQARAASPRISSVTEHMPENLYNSRISFVQHHFAFADLNNVLTKSNDSR